MKRIITLLIAGLILIGFTACVSSTPSPTAENGTLPAASEMQAITTETDSLPAASEAPESTPGHSGGTDSTPVPENKKVLVVVFSATGTTKGVAEKIAAIENADIYEIKAKQEYTAADLNWNDRNSRSTKEQNSKSVRPEIGSERISLEGYEKIYIGFPIWWGEEPRIMDTFVESYDFSGITLIPFCTSSSSGIGRSGKNLEENAKSGKWLDGRRFSGSVSEADLRNWINGLK